jgi:hypothetical protein
MKSILTRTEKPKNGHQPSGRALFYTPALQDAIHINAEKSDSNPVKT